jgi:hypothetical protein
MMERRLFLIGLIALECHCDASSIRTLSMAFAGFGSSTGKSKGASKKEKKPVRMDLETPQGRMDHIQNCIQRASTSALTSDPNALCLVDNFLGPKLVTAMRTEAASIRETMVPSQSTKWDEELKRVVAYEKQGVLSTQLLGGPEGYAMTPRLVEYIVTLTKHLSSKINQQLKAQDCKLSTTQQTNKLAVCLGNGSKYDKHIDNLGGGGMGLDADHRKLTALLYLQPVGSHAENSDHPERLDERGGYFRAYDVPRKEDVKIIAPRGDRLLLFWSDALVHDVSPSFCLDENKDERWALTIWFVVDEGGVIRETNAEIEQRHFGTG